MADLKDEEEHALFSNSKRKPDLTFVDKDIALAHAAESDPNKKQKPNYCTDNNPSIPQEEKFDEVDEEDEHDDDEADYESEDDDDDEDDDDEHSNGKAKIDSKGKGILVDNKGKGKFIEESDDLSESDCDSDLSDDPLAEVDLDNILPSRTRRRAVQPGLYISKDLGKDVDDDDTHA
ncbi:unnamed protein product [Ilex paraguariensis]|uniref:Uncharacterized protein n=1 Tax=Ilex paraguariensis TaxID=185542 RepID=A0ABC8USE2_9AQUA